MDMEESMPKSVSDWISLVANVLGALSVIGGVIYYWWERDERADERHFAAWSILAQDHGSRSGQVRALEKLAKEKVPLTSLRLFGTDISGTQIPDANLEYAQITYSNLESADLKNAHLKGAWLTCTNLAKANLKGADFEGTHLEGVELTDADLTGATNITPEQTGKACTVSGENKTVPGAKFQSCHQDGPPHSCIQ